MTNRLLLEAGVGTTQPVGRLGAAGSNSDRNSSGSPSSAPPAARNNGNIAEPQYRSRTGRPTGRARSHVARLGVLRDRRAEHEVRLPGRLPGRQSVHLHATTRSLPTASTTACRTRSPRRSTPFDVQAARALRLVLRAGTVDDGPDDAPGRRAVRPRLELVPRGDRRSGAASCRPPITYPETQGVARLQRHHAARRRRRGMSSAPARRRSR